MKLPYSEPVPSSNERGRKSRDLRQQIAEFAYDRPHAYTHTNGEETDQTSAPKPYPANFTKGLAHDQYGLLESPEDYACFVKAINSPDPDVFEKEVATAATRGKTYHCRAKETCHGREQVTWRGWESPRAGHCYDLQGADAGACGMAPAPRVGSSELALEMAEVYAMALLRDVPFSTICTGGDERLCASAAKGGPAHLSAAQIVDLLNAMPFLSGKKAVSSTPHNIDDAGLNRFEQNRRFARTLSSNGKLATEILFRGSTKGAHLGPYISQFMLIGARSLACAGGGASSYPALEAGFDLRDGLIPYGSLVIDQRTFSHKNCLDYMTDWGAWLDVQNGANLRGTDLFEQSRRFITTPRDLATFVHFDALYEAYLNACLIMKAMGVPKSKGFPEASASGHRDAFATYGDPHILSLVTEVATRCLKAVRRQKFNFHRRARPEALGGRLTLQCLGLGTKLGCAEPAFAKTLAELPAPLLKAIAAHNKDQNQAAMRKMRRLHAQQCTFEDKAFAKLDACNYLLPMAFPEGSPMHPSYGAGHATVAGGCVTLLKAFFEMFTDRDSFEERALCDSHGNAIAYEPNDKGTALKKVAKFKGKLTIQGELDKLAANISIGRNMAGVHYYSDYYDSLRMGERVAVSLLQEQLPTFGEYVEVSFTSFDGDYLVLKGEACSRPQLFVLDKHGNPVAQNNWWLRHVAGGF